MPKGFPSILFLTILLAIGLYFFLRAASKDRTTVIDVKSPLPPLKVLDGIIAWLDARGWKSNGGDAERPERSQAGEAVGGAPKGPSIGDWVFRSRPFCPAMVFKGI